MERKREDLTPAYFRYIIHFIRPFPDFDFFFIKSLRQKAVKLLNLKEGNRVLDIGCGPGGSFSYLVNAVGSTGEVIGVEISPEVAINARKRIGKNKWKNIQVIEEDAQTVHLTGKFDGAIMFGAPDIFASQESLENILLYLRKNARIVVFGAKTSSNGLGRILNPLLQILFKLSFSTTPKLESEPWRILAKYVEGLDIEEYFFGLMFLASGSFIKGKK